MDLSRRQHCRRGVGLFSQLHSPTAIAFLRRYPTSHAAATLTQAKLAAFLRRLRYCGRKPVTELLGRLQTAPAAGISSAEAAGRAICVPALLDAIQACAHQERELEAEIIERLETHADQHTFTRLPRAGHGVRAANLLGELGDVRARFPDEDTLAGAAPVTITSGKRQVVKFRWACDKKLRNALMDFADDSRHASPGRPRSTPTPWPVPDANLSLGGEPTNGSDPLSQAVNQLTASAGMLVVVAAGNAGPSARTVSAPGAADAALTVGAVDADDTLADFSSRGPRAGDLAIKPDIVAPGVDIIQARAAGTLLGTPVGHLYTRLSGTSMATPHVAGAAAILAQQHPGWSAAQVKAALEDTSTVLPERSVYQQGGGRLDLAHAIGQQLLGDRNNLDFGDFTWPHTSAQRVSRQLTLTNTGRSAVTLRLAVDLHRQDRQPAAAGMATLSASQLTLGAGQSGRVSVTVDPTMGTPSFYSGQLTATPSDGGSSAAALHIPVGFYQEPPSYDLTVKAVPLPGTPAGATTGVVDVINIDDASLFREFFMSLEADGTKVVHVPAGHYSVLGAIADTNPKVLRVAQVGDPEVDVHADTTVLLDGPAARPLAVRVAGRPTEVATSWAQYAQRSQRPGSWEGAAWVDAPYATAFPLLVQPTRPVNLGSFQSDLYARLRAPQLTMTINGQPAPLAPTVGDGSPLPPAGTRHLAVVDAGNGSATDFASLHAHGKLAVVGWSDTLDQRAVVQRAADAGAAMVAFANDTKGPLVPQVFPTEDGQPPAALLTIGVPASDARRLLALASSGGTVTVTGRPASPYVYDLLDPRHDRFPPDPARTLGPADQARLARVDERFAALEGQAGTVIQDTRYGLRSDRLLALFGSYLPQPVPATRTDYVTADDTVRWAPVVITMPPFGDEASSPLLTPGSHHAETWGRQPLYTSPAATLPDANSAACQGLPVIRTRNTMFMFINVDKE